jgi:hypothetical protein
MSTDRELREALVEVVKAARAWRKALTEFATIADLIGAIDALDALMGERTPAQGMIRWDAVVPGWFVKTPKGEWWEVLGNVADSSSTRRVTFKIDGKEIPIGRRPSADFVPVRRAVGGAPGNPDEAVRAIMDAFPGTVVLEDWS